MDALYQEIILDHYRNPVGKGLREPHEAEVHHVNPTCGDEITLRVHLTGSGEDSVVADISYDNQGCSISQASASVMYELSLRSVAGGAGASGLHRTRATLPVSRAATPSHRSDQERRR